MPTVMASKMIAGTKRPMEKTLRFMIEEAPSIDPRRDWHLPGAPFLLASLLLAGAMTMAWWITRVAKSEG